MSLLTLLFTLSLVNAKIEPNEIPPGKLPRSTAGALVFDTFSLDGTNEPFALLARVAAGGVVADFALIIDSDVYVNIIFVDSPPRTDTVRNFLINGMNMKL